jgi:hypothetical protein
MSIVTALVKRHPLVVFCLSGVEIEIPASTAARIIAEPTLGSVDVGDGFTKREGAFLTEGALSGNVPVLTIRAGVRLGSLQLRAR